MSKTVQKIVLVITSTETMEDVERWQFDVDCDKEATADPRFVDDTSNQGIKCH